MINHENREDGLSPLQEREERQKHFFVDLP